MMKVPSPCPSFFMALALVVCLFVSNYPAEGVSHNLLASAGIDSEELYLSRPLTPKEWEILGLKYIRTTVNGIEKYKLEMPALEMLDLLAKIGYRVVGMTRAPTNPRASSRGHEGGGFWWTLVKETDE